MRKLAKNERICKNCHRIYRIKGNIRNRKYCSTECAAEAEKRIKNHRSSLGTNTVALGEKSVKNELKKIRNYKKKNKVSYSISYRDILLASSVYRLDDDNNRFVSLDLL